MKLTIEDGRDHFYTFDTNRILILTATDEEQINQVEFSTEENGETVSWTSDVLTGEDGIKYVQVPNEFLNGNYSRLVCYYVALDSNGEFTRQKEVFRIRARQEPEDYYLTYSERVTFASIKALTEQYKATTKQYMDTTEGFKDNAGRSAELASKYAENNEDVAVEPGKYSAKHWSIKAEAAKETAVQKATEAGTSEVNSKTYMESAQSAKQDAETAKNAANTILEQVQSKGTEITNFVATSKTEIETQKNESVNAVKSVYQTDLNELKGDLDTEMNARIEADTDHSTKIQKNRYEIDNLKAKAEGKLYRTETVESEAYVLDVPSSVAPYAEVQRIGGKSMVWNQLRQSYNIQTEYGITVSSNGDGTINVQGTVTSTPDYNQFPITNNIIFKRDGRKYLITSNLDIPNGFGISGHEVHNTKNFIFSSNENSYWNGYVFIKVTEGNVLNLSNLAINIIDLTQMFGSGNEPTLKECENIFSDDYYPYDAGTIKSFPVKTVKSVGKNLCLAKDVYAGAKDYLETTLDGRDCIRFISATVVKNKPIRFKENTQYTVSFDLKMVEKYSSGVSENVFAFFYTDGSESIQNAGKDSFTDWKRISKTSDENKTVLYVGLASIDYRTYCYVSNFQLEEGSTATNYTPYMESTLDVSSVTSDLKSAGSVHDEWSNGKKTKRIKTYTFTGNENWNVNGSSYQTVELQGIRRPENWYSKNVVITDAGLSTNVSQSTLYNGIDTSGITMGDNGNIVISSSDYANRDTLLNGKTVYFEVDSYEETVPEISNFIKVESGGTITFESDDAVHMPVPSTDRFVVDLTSTTEETT